MLNFFLSAAETTAEAPGGLAGILGSIGPILLLIVMFAVLYFVMIRPQKKAEKEAQNMRDNISVGDEITTIGGIIGEVVSVKGETVTIETSKAGTKVRFLKSAIRSVDVSAADKKKAADEKAE